MSDTFLNIFTSTIGPVPVAALVVVVLFILAEFLLLRGRLGQRLYGVGSSSEASHIVGINTAWVRGGAYVFCALCAAAAGLLIAGRIGSGDPQAGSSFTLASVTAVVVGGVSVFGGRGTAVGVLAGAIAVGVMENALNLMQVSAYYQYIWTGGLTLIAVAGYSLRMGKGRRAMTHALDNEPPAADCVVDCKNILGEVPVWDMAEQALYWVDIEGCLLQRLIPASGAVRRWQLPERVCAFALRESGGLILALASGFAFFDLDTRQLTRLASPEAHLPGNRMNEGKCDSRGRFWAGTMDDSLAARSGALYRFDADLSCHRMESGIGISNSIAWSPDDKRLLLCGHIAAHDLRL